MCFGQRSKNLHLFSYTERRKKEKISILNGFFDLIFRIFLFSFSFNFKNWMEVSKYLLTLERKCSKLREKKCLHIAQYILIYKEIKHIC